MTVAHRLTHRAKPYSLETYESNSRWPSRAAMAMDRVSDGAEILADLVDHTSRAFRKGRASAHLTRKEAYHAAHQSGRYDAFMSGYRFALRYQRPTLTPLHEYRKEN
jgi:hypothetical protein